MGRRLARDLWRRAGFPVIWARLFELPALAATAYYSLAIVAALRWRRGDRQFFPAALERASGDGKGNGTGARQPLSILKPIHGRDPQFYEAIVSHARQDYPEFEILFGVTDPDDPALEDIERLKREFPQVAIGVHTVYSKAPNAKVGVLAELAAQARYPLLLVNDSDIVVEPGYLRSVTAPLDDPEIGLVTCLYRAEAESQASRAEALGIATEFAPSVLVARLLGMADFALGSTMVFRAEALRRFGGFAAIASYLADDYQLGQHIAKLGYRIEFAPVVVETDLGGESWARNLAAPIAVVAHHPGFPPGRVLRLCGDARDLVGDGGFRRASMVGRRRGAHGEDGRGDAGGGGRPEGSPREARFLVHPGARYVRVRGLAGRGLRAACGLARPAAVPAPGRQHFGAVLPAAEVLRVVLVVRRNSLMCGSWA